MGNRMRFGIFMAPFHPAGENPTLLLEGDLALIEHLDRLGFDEAWFGEHHSAGYEIIASPEVFVAAAAERTKHIRLGTGVSSLPYHHPFMLADRMVLLDHLTRGRAMFGVGPGALPSDAFMLGIDPIRQREMMDEALEAILALLTADEPITREASWFTMRDARLHLRPFSRPHMEVAVAAQVSPAGPRAAGKYGISLLSLGATTVGGFDVLVQQWGNAE
jgi:limonene 1,2-monooxygenase